jgi:hypothetical protein
MARRSLMTMLKLDERGLIKCLLWRALRTQAGHYARAKAPTTVIGTGSSITSSANYWFA